MCGIVVGLTFGELPEVEEKIRQKMLRCMTTELLLLTESRGKDATGAAALFDDGRYIGIKRGEEVTSFLSVFGNSKEYYGGFLKVWEKHPAPVRVYLGHCRAGTGGAKEDNNNNHPIKIRNMIGIHNGVVHNDKEIFENLGCKRDGEVDSEAIFRLFDHFTNHGKEPFTMDMIQEVVRRLDSFHTVCLFNADNPYQVPIFRDRRPCYLVFIKEWGLLFAISEPGFWATMRYRYERMANYYDAKMPSLFRCTIEKKELPDDSCIIFDLTKGVEDDTVIDDLGEYSKILRTNKIWQKPTTTYTRGTDYQRNTCGYKPGSGNNNSDSDDSTRAKKRRVFDRLEKKYVIKQGDKVLKDDSSITIDVDNCGDNDDDDDSETGGSEDNTIHTPVTTDFEEQENLGTKADKTDLTEYTQTQYKSKEKKIIDSKEYVTVYNYLKSEGSLNEPLYSEDIGDFLAGRIQIEIKRRKIVALNLPGYYLTLKLRDVKKWKDFLELVNKRNSELKKLALDIPTPTYKYATTDATTDDDIPTIEAEVVDEDDKDKGKDVGEVEVDMDIEHAAIGLKAESLYKLAPIQEKGFINIKELIEAVDIKDEKTAKDVGPVFIANRVVSRSWKHGFLHGYMCSQQEDVENLKNIISLLAGVITEKKHKARLANAAMKSGSSVDLNMEKIKKLFSGTKRLEEIANILNDAHQYANTGGEKKK